MRHDTTGSGGYSGLQRSRPTKPFYVLLRFPSNICLLVALVVPKEEPPGHTRVPVIPVSLSSSVYATNAMGFTSAMDFVGDKINLSSSALYIGLALVGVLAWRRYLSPIRHIPGPFVASFTRLWHIRQIFAGDQNLNLIKLHDKHGNFNSATGPDPSLAR